MALPRQQPEGGILKVARLHWVPSFLLVICLACPLKVDAAGFAVFTHGAKETSMIGNVIAHTEGPASNYYNPALLTELEGTQVEVGTTLIAPKKKYTTGGQTYETESDVFYPSSLYLSHAFDNRVALGLGVNSPFGLGSDWGKTWPGRYVATTSSLSTININPNAGLRLTDNLSLSVGADIMLASASLEKNLNLAAYGLSDANAKFSGDGKGYGLNLGVVYSPTDDWSFGASYRSKVRLKIDGSVENTFPSNTPAAVLDALTALLPNTDGSTEIILPPQVFGAICYRGIERLTLEAGVRWEGWSTYRDLTFNYDQRVMGSYTSTTAKNWDDTFSYSIGAKYDLTDTWAVLAGYRYGETPVPDETFDPSVLGSAEHDYTLGIAAHSGNLTGSLGYLFQNFESRTKENTIGATVGGAANGSYDQTGHAVAISLSYAY